MKVKIVKQWVWSSAESAMRHFGLDIEGDRQITRLLLEEQRIAITPDQGLVHVYFLKPDEKFDVVGEADISGEIVLLAAQLAHSRREMEAHHDKLCTLIPRV
jgi:hypothetical protein